MQCFSAFCWAWGRFFFEKGLVVSFLVDLFIKVSIMLVVSGVTDIYGYESPGSVRADATGAASQPQGQRAAPTSSTQFPWLPACFSQGGAHQPSNISTLKKPCVL